MRPTGPQPVAVDLERHHDAVRLMVHDQGLGMPADVLQPGGRAVLHDEGTRARPRPGPLPCAAVRRALRRCVDAAVRPRDDRHPRRPRSSGGHAAMMPVEQFRDGRTLLIVDDDERFRDALDEGVPRARIRRPRRRRLRRSPGVGACRDPGAGARRPPLAGRVRNRAGARVQGARCHDQRRGADRIRQHRYRTSRASAPARPPT